MQAVNTDLTQTLSPHADNVTFHMEKMGENENATVLQIGSRVHFLLAIQFPRSTTDMLVRNPDKYIEPHSVIELNAAEILIQCENNMYGFDYFVSPSVCPSVRLSVDI